MVVGLKNAKLIEMLDIRKRFYKLLSICIYERISRLIASAQLVRASEFTTGAVINYVYARITIINQ